MVLLIHGIGLVLFHVAYIAGALLTRAIYTRQTISRIIWAWICVVWMIVWLPSGVTLLLEAADTHRWGAAWMFAPLAFLPVITEHVHCITWILDKMAPKTVAEKVEELTRKYESEEREAAHRADRLSLDTRIAKPDDLLLGRNLKSNFLVKGGIIERGDVIGVTAHTLSQNMLIVGAVGSGKTTLLLRLIQQLAANTDRDIFVVDGKGDEDFAQDVATIIHITRKCQVPILRVGSEKEGAPYNPFAGTPKAIFNRLCAMAGVLEQEGVARFYGRRNMDILQLVCYAPEGAPVSFDDLRRRLSKDWLLSAYTKDKQSTEEIKSIDKDAMRDLQVSLRPIVRDFSPLTHPEGFTIESAGCAIFSLNTSSAGITAKEFVDLLIDDIKDAMSHRMRRPSVWIIDEFLVLRNESISDLLTIGRSRGVSVALAMQSIDAVTDDRTREAMLQNCRTKVIMSQDKPETLAMLAGTVKGIEIGTKIAGGTATDEGTVRAQDQFKIDPNEVRGLNAGECFILRQGEIAKIKVSPVRDLTRTDSAELVIERPTTPTSNESEDDPDTQELRI